MKNKLFLLLSFLFLLGLLEAVISIQINEPITNTTVENTTVLEYVDEHVIIENVNGQTFIGSDPKITSEEDLISYQQKMVERLNYFVNSSFSSQGTFTTLTFSNPLTEEEVVEIVQSSGFEILSLRYISTDGGGEIPYPIDHERLAEMEQRIAEFERTYNNITDFVLIKGYVAANVFLPLNDTSLLDNNNMFLVDVGPVEFLELYPDAIIIPGRDLFYRYNKTIASNDTAPPVINYVDVVPSITNSSSTITVSANVTDNVVVDMAVVDLNGTGTELKDTDGDGIFTASDIIPPVTEGTYIVNVTAYDLAGNSAYDDSAEITVDNTSPTLTITSPLNATYLTASLPFSIFLTFTVDEATSWIGYSLDGAGDQAITGNTILSSLDTGLRNLTVYAEDMAGNMGLDSVWFTVLLDSDNDGDGYPVEVDCDDSELLINPGAVETANGIDDNCDGTVDEGFPICTPEDEEQKRHFMTTHESVDSGLLRAKGELDGYEGSADDDIFVYVGGVRYEVGVDSIPANGLIEGIEIESTELVPLTSNVIHKNTLKVKGLKHKDGDNLFAYSGRYFSLWDPFFNWVYVWDTATVDNSGDPDYAGFASLGITTADRVKIHLDLKSNECKIGEEEDTDDDGILDVEDEDDDDDNIIDADDMCMEDGVLKDCSKDFDNDGLDDKDDDDDDNDGKKDHKDKHAKNKDKK